MQKSLKTYLQPSFLICVAILALAGGLKDKVFGYFDLILSKEAIPLQKAFGLIDKEKLHGYKVLNESKIENKDILESLGTEEYIQWMIEDTDAHPYSPTKYCQLFITYYTGDPDQVPHVPEECYVGAGSTKLGSDKRILKLPKVKPITQKDDLETEYRDFDVRHLTFSLQSRSIWENDSVFSVLYFFNVNGEYASGRSETRLALQKNLFSKYSYFSKVEWRFYSNGEQASTEEVISASEKLLTVLLPILEKEHWPDWEKANQQKDLNK